jgi:hypothetical protein
LEARGDLLFVATIIIFALLNINMAENNFNKDRLSIYWIESSDNDYKTMLDLFDTRNYSWALFIRTSGHRKTAQSILHQDTGGVSAFNSRFETHWGESGNII